MIFAVNVLQWDFKGKKKLMDILHWNVHAFATQFQTMNYSRCMTFSTVYGFVFFSLLFSYLSCPRSIYSVSNRFQLILLTVTCITEGSWLFRLAVAFWFSDYNRKQNYILLHNTSSNKRNICNGRNDRLPTVFIQKIFFSLPSQEKLIVMHAYYMLHALTSQ